MEIDINMSGSSIEKKAVLVGMYLDEMRQNYTIEFEERIYVDSELVTRKRHRITEGDEKWEYWNENIGAQIRPLIENDIRNYFDSE